MKITIEREDSPNITVLLVVSQEEAEKILAKIPNAIIVSKAKEKTKEDFWNEECGVNYD